MKKNLLMVSILILAFSSCDNQTITTSYTPDISLAGSVSMGSRQITKSECIFGDNSFTGFKSNESVLIIGKVSDEKILLWCRTKWVNESIEISLPPIPISGQPYNVYFDYEGIDGTVIYNNIKLTPVRVSVNGWIKRDGIQTRNVSKSTQNISDPAIYSYACDISINCIFNEDSLTLKIFSIS